MMEGFEQIKVDVGGGVTLRVRHGGVGTPVVLLHGHPRTHTTWHRVAPLLVAAGPTVVCPDLRGYGQSSKPVTTADHAPYSKRAMAADVLTLMDRLGHERFAVVGHDRGSYVASRLALDAPQAVSSGRPRGTRGPSHPLPCVSRRLKPCNRHAASSASRSSAHCA